MLIEIKYIYKLRNENLQLWVKKLCHQNYKHVKYLKKKGFHTIEDNIFCEDCAYEKYHMLSFHNRSDGAIIHEMYY